MSPELRLALAIGVSSAVALAATPLAIRIATRIGFLDVPVDYKRHPAPTPYLGGAAVLLGLVAAYLVTGDLDGLGVVTAGAALLWAVGSLDDLLNLRPELRVLAEVAAGVLLWADGIRFPLASGEAASLALTVFWIVAVVNAVNLMDNLDGAAASVAAVSGAAIAAVAVIADEPAVAAMAAGLAAACVVFLRFNLTRPARIFLGDGGSMPIGFTLGACAIMATSSAQHGAWAAVAAILMVGLPALDTALVIVSRRRRGAPVLTGARDHITHRLHVRLRSERSVAAILAGAQALLGAWAVALVALDRPVQRAALSVALGSVLVVVLVAYHGGVASRLRHAPDWDPGGRVPDP
jgi:UDP-GlcNAc:undecaprenyl-phosphate GlcNAc-1-phosphate transferase